MREQYSPGFYLKDGDASLTRRSIKIKVDAMNVLVRARRNYFFGLDTEDTQKR